jgi:hypothetical protein
MPSRRTFLRASAAALLASSAAAIVRAGDDEFFAYLPAVERHPPPTPTPTEAPTAEPTEEPWEPVPPGPTEDAPLVGPATGTVTQAVAWLAPRADASYTEYDVRVICEAYQRVGDSVGMDWFLAIAQMAHETGHLTSFWSLRPQRNPAGIGVTASCPGNPQPNAPGWAYNYQRGCWEAGVSFATWADDAVPAHLGRLLAYALRDEDAGEAQRALIAQALAYRALPADRRGVAPRWVDLNGRWAVPGTTYGQSIIALARRMRGEA